MAECSSLCEINAGLNYTKHWINIAGAKTPAKEKKVRPERKKEGGRVEKEQEERVKKEKDRLKRKGKEECMIPPHPPNQAVNTCHVTHLPN